MNVKIRLSGLQIIALANVMLVAVSFLDTALPACIEKRIVSDTHTLSVVDDEGTKGWVSYISFRNGEDIYVVDHAVAHSFIPGEALNLYKTYWFGKNLALEKKDSYKVFYNISLMHYLPFYLFLIVASLISLYYLFFPKLHEGFLGCSTLIIAALLSCYYLKY